MTRSKSWLHPCWQHFPVLRTNQPDNFWEKAKHKNYVRSVLFEEKDLLHHKMWQETRDKTDRTDTLALAEAIHVNTNVKYWITPVHKQWILVLHVQASLSTHWQHKLLSLFVPDTHTRTLTHTLAPVLCMCT